MIAFRRLEGSVAILKVKGGIYRQAELFELKGGLFAKYGSGFVRLAPGGYTSNLNVMYDDYDAGPTASVKVKGLNFEVKMQVQESK